MASSSTFTNSNKLALDLPKLIKSVSVDFLACTSKSITCGFVLDAFTIKTDIASWFNTLNSSVVVITGSATTNGSGNVVLSCWNSFSSAFQS